MSDIMLSTLAAILPDNKARLFYLQEHVEADYFTGAYQDLWKIIDRIAVITGGEVASEPAIRKSLDRILDFPIERRAAVEEVLHNAVNHAPVSESDFKSSVSFLEEDYKKNVLGEGLSDALEVLTHGVRNKDGLTFGVDPAVESLRLTLAEIERVSYGAMPEGNVFEEKADILRELQESDVMDRILTGIRPLDELTFGGAGAGELWLIAAYAGVGKTFFCTNLAYYFAMIEKKNVVYLTAETLRTQVRRRVLVRHSHHPKFGIPNGLSSAALKKHTPENPILTPQQVEQWMRVIDDFSENKDRGILNIAQIPMGAKVSTVHAKLNKINNICPVDVVIVDSLDLLAPEVRRGNIREELNDILAQAKHLATSFDNGRGTRIISPWQTSRDSWKEAKQNGRYTKSCLAETAEAERKADLILALLEDPSSEFKLKGQTLKFRDATPRDFEVNIDYDRCFVGSSEGIGFTHTEALLGGFDEDF